MRREERLVDEEQRWIRSKDLSIQIVYEELKAKSAQELAELRNELKERAKESRRINNSFNIVRQSNVVLKQQLKEKNDRILKLEEQNFSLNSRINNLQVCIAFFFKIIMLCHLLVVRILLQQFCLF